MTTNTIVKCELCNKEVQEEKAVYFNGDIEVNINYIEATNTYCIPCAKENDLI